MAETAEIRHAHDALRAGKPSEALEALAVYAQKHPRGILKEEAAATSVFALCAADRVDEARKQALTFLEAWPRSPLVGRVKSSCAAH